MPSNKILLIAACVILLGIFGFLAMDRPNEKTLGESIDEATEEIKDEIDDHTTSK